MPVSRRSSRWPTNFPRRHARALTLARDAVMAALFYEPSTRTRMSFEAAMLRLGGQVIAMTDPHASSAAKGETLADTVRIVESYTDLIVLRHPREGAAQVAADFAGIPVINAGDGAREHPTQTLLDLYTIYQEKGRLAGITVALCGDLKHGRTVHSLAQALARFGAQIICVAPPGLELPAPLRRQLATRVWRDRRAVSTRWSARRWAIAMCCMSRACSANVLPTRRNSSACASSYQVSRQTLTRTREDAIVLHPLPRVDELDYALDGDPRAAYFRQAAYGVPVRMALIAALLGFARRPGSMSDPRRASRVGVAPAAGMTRFVVTIRAASRSAEPGITAWAQVRDDGARRCAYCECHAGGGMSRHPDPRCRISGRDGRSAGGRARRSAVSIRAHRRRETRVIKARRADGAAGVCVTTMCIFATRA